MSDAKGQPEPTMEEILESIRRVISKDGEAVEDGEDVLVLRDLAPESEPGDVLELTEVVGEERTAPALPGGAAEGAPALRIGSRPGPERKDSISREAAERTAMTLTDFVSTVSSAPGVRVGGADRTLEDLVRELLQPMLKEWLGNNLQPVVSRAVARELTKLVGRIDDD